MKKYPHENYQFYLRNSPNPINSKPQSNQMIELDIIEYLSKEVRQSGESRMSEEIRLSEQLKSSNKSKGVNFLDRSLNYTNENLKFVSAISSDNSQKLFKHKCSRIQDEYLTCECNKYLNEKCRRPQCTKNCVSFKFQNNRKLYEKIVRDSRSSANTASGISESQRESIGYFEMPNNMAQIKFCKELVCKCEAGRCRNNKCPCKKNGQFCDLKKCDCRECRNLLLFSEISAKFTQNKMKQQSQNQQRSESPIVQESNSVQFEEINLMVRINSSSMEFQN